jgi:hypothetical protein
MKRLIFIFLAAMMTAVVMAGEYWVNKCEYTSSTSTEDLIKEPSYCSLTKSSVDTGNGWEPTLVLDIHTKNGTTIYRRWFCKSYKSKLMRCDFTSNHSGKEFEAWIMTYKWDDMDERKVGFIFRDNGVVQIEDFIVGRKDKAFYIKLLGNEGTRREFIDTMMDAMDEGFVEAERCSDYLTFKD